MFVKLDILLAANCSIVKYVLCFTLTSGIRDIGHEEVVVGSCVVCMAGRYICEPGISYDHGMFVGQI